MTSHAATRTRQAAQRTSVRRLHAAGRHAAPPLRCDPVRAPARRSRANLSLPVEPALAPRVVAVWHRLTVAARGWQYAASAEASGSRDLRLDLLRGFCVFAMLVDHLGGDSWLYAVTGGNRFYVSAAEGFVFLSGLVVGQVYRRKIERDGLASAMLHALRRARTLWLTTSVLTLAFATLFLYSNLSLWVDRTYGLGVDDLTDLVVGAITLHFTYQGTDILGIYAFLMLATPFSLLMLTSGRGRWLLFLAWGWWLAYQIAPGEATLRWRVQNSENFPLAAWQVLFTTGMALGYHRAAVAAWARPRVWLRLTVVASAVLLMAVLVFVFNSSGQASELGGFSVSFSDGASPGIADALFAKPPLRPARLVAFAAAAAIAFAVATYGWQPLRRALGWLLLPLGRRALYGFIMQFPLILLTYNLAPLVLGGDEPSVFVGTLQQLLVLAVLWGMVKRQVLFRIVPS